MESKSKLSDPFESLRRLGQKSPYYLSLPSKPQQENADDPQLIILCTWTDAQSKHIAKYIAGHRALFPTTPIILARVSTTNYFHMSSSTGDPAIKFLTSHLKTFKDPKILTHCLSNGGIGHLTFLARAYHRNTNGNSLPLHSIIYDSAPTRGDFRSLYSALSQTFPHNPIVRRPLTMLLTILITLFFVLPRVFGFRNTSDRVCDDLLGEVSGGKKFIRDGATRTFLYSDLDGTTPMKEVLVEAKLAEDRSIRVRREIWVGSGHVSHMRADPERYWGVIGES